LTIGAVGNFKEGEAVFIRDETGNHIASGISNYDAAQLKKIFAKKSDEVKKILGQKSKKEVIHIDNLVVV